MKRLLLTVLFFACLVSSASAKIIQAANCSQDAFEDAYYRQSVPGDIIVLPAGNGTWGDPSRANEGVIYIITNVTVIGQGDSTVITMHDGGKTRANGVIGIWAAATFARMKIVGSSVSPVTAFQVVPFTNNSDADYAKATKGVAFNGGFRITDITYVGGTGSNADAYFVFVSEGIETGLIDNCRITGGNGGAELILTRGPTNAWFVDSQVGKAQNVFIEDCTFFGDGYVCDANSNASLVVRYNTINGQNKVDGHGIATNTPRRSFRSMEVYNNRWTGAGAAATAIEIRGGTAMVFDNISDYTGGAGGDRFLLTEYGYQNILPNFGVTVTNVSVGNPTTITTSAPHGYQNGWNIAVLIADTSRGSTAPNIVYLTTPVISGGYNVTVTGPNTFTIPVDVTAVLEPLNNRGSASRFMTAYDYPIDGQLGVGKDPKVAASEPAYVFNNLKKGVAWTRNFWAVNTNAFPLYRTQIGDTTGTATFTESDVIKANRDFFADAGFDTATGVSRGTKAQMLAFTPSLVGYGWWVTDEGTWNKKLEKTAPNTSGQLYTWRGPGTGWVLKYTPYTYPHPARLPIPASNLRFNP